MLNHTERKEKTKPTKHQRHLHSSLCKLRFHTGIWTGAMLSDLAMAAPVPYIAAPYLSCCGCHLAGSPSSENFRLRVPEKQQRLFTAAGVGRNDPQHWALAREGNLCPLSPCTAACSGADTGCQRHLVTEIPLISCAQAENTGFL